MKCLLRLFIRTVVCDSIHCDHGHSAKSVVQGSEFYVLHGETSSQ